MVSSPRPTIAILCIFVEAIQQVHQLGRGTEKKKKVTKNDIKGGHAVEKVMSLTQILLCTFHSFFLGFSRSSDNITVSKKRSTSKKEPSSISAITIHNYHIWAKYYNCTTLSVWIVYIYMFV